MKSRQKEKRDNSKVKGIVYKFKVLEKKTRKNYHMIR